MSSVPAADPLVSIIVPAYNEAKQIATTLGKIQTYLDAQDYAYEIIVSADGTDGTREAAAELAKKDPRIIVIGTPERGGKGKGVRQGVMRARGTYVGNVDADYKTPIEEFAKILPALREGIDVVIGSRRVGDFRIERPQPLYRRLGSQAFAVVMRNLIGLRDVQDTQCGFKFFQREVARDLFTRQQVDGYMYDVEILRLARILKYQIKEVGVRWADDGDSRYDPIAGTWRNAKELLRIRRLCRGVAKAERAKARGKGRSMTAHRTSTVAEAATAPAAPALAAHS